MSQSEVEQYQFQLDQVDLALVDDPTNEELLKLKSDLQELISLTSQYEKAGDQDEPTKKEEPQPQPIPSMRTALKTHQFHIGQEVRAKWSQDGQFYRATITAIGGADQIFSVQFRGYKDIEVVPVSDIQPLEKDLRKGIFEGIKGVDTNTSSVSIGANAEDKKKKDVKKVKKVNVAEVKKNSWLDFAKDKKGKRKKAINTKSIFRTPDSLDSKVGVVGSGRGMTGYHQQGKHSFQSGEPADDD